MKDELMFFVSMYIEDVAEDPSRLKRAIELVEFEIAKILDKHSSAAPSPATNYS